MSCLHAVSPLEKVPMVRRSDLVPLTPENMELGDDLYGLYVSTVVLKVYRIKRTSFIWCHGRSTA